jgi:hypothetical protein
MTAPKVYVPQIPSRIDHLTREWVPTVNIQAAAAHGEMVVLLPPNANRLATAQLVTALKERMDDYTTEDWLVAVGDPSLIAAAACIAAKRTGGLLRLLKWDRQTSDYLPTEIRL